MFTELIARKIGDLAKSKLAPVDVAVIDSGIDATHPALRGRVHASYIVGPSGKRAMAMKRRAPGRHDRCGHGTAVASVIARIAPNARLIDVRIFDEDNFTTGRHLTAALGFAVSRRWPVVNLSLAAKHSFLDSISAECERAYYAGQTIVAARRNVPLAGRSIPAELPAVIGVDRAGALAELAVAYFAHGPVEFGARGENVTVAVPGGGYQRQTGTSFATPVIAALCAIYKGRDPSLTLFELKALLKAHAEPRR